MMFWGMEFPTKMKLISNKSCLLCAHKVVISVIILCVNLLHTQKKLIWKIDGINKGYHFIQSIRYYQQAKSRLMIFMQTSFFIEIYPLIFWYVQTCYNQTTYRISMSNFFSVQKHVFDTLFGRSCIPKHTIRSFCSWLYCCRYGSFVQNDTKCVKFWQYTKHFIFEDGLKMHTYKTLTAEKCLLAWNCAQCLCFEDEIFIFIIRFAFTIFLKHVQTIRCRRLFSAPNRISIMVILNALFSTSHSAPLKSILPTVIVFLCLQMNFLL